MHHSIMPGRLRGSQLALEIGFRYTRGKEKQEEKGKTVKRMRKKRKEKRLGEEVIKMILE